MKHYKTTIFGKKVEVRKTYGNCPFCGEWLYRMPELKRKFGWCYKCKKPRRKIPRRCRK